MFKKIYRKLIYIIPFLIVLYTWFKLIYTQNQLVRIDGPFNRINILKESKKLKHFASEHLAKSDTISIYNYNEYEMFFLVTRFKTEQNSLKNILNIQESGKNRLESFQFYKGSIFNSGLRYSFPKSEIINKVSIISDEILIENIKVENDSVFYFSKELKDDLSIVLNDNHFALSRKEYNHIVLKLKNDMLYLIFAKSRRKRNENINILKEFLK